MCVNVCVYVCALVCIYMYVCTQATTSQWEDEICLVADNTVLSKVEELLSKYEASLTTQSATAPVVPQPTPIIQSPTPSQPQPVLSNLLESYIQHNHSTSNCSILRTFISELKLNKPAMYVGRVQRVSSADFGTKKTTTTKNSAKHSEHLKFIFRIFCV